MEMSMWDESEKAADEASQGGMFLSLASDGASAKVVIVGEPLPEKKVWTGNGYEDYDEAKHADKSPSTRIKVNAFNVSENKMQIWEMNPTTFKGLLKVRAKYGLDKKIFEITRSGAKGDMKTTYSILPDDDISPALAERIKHEKLLDLTGKNDPSGSPSGNNRELLIGILRNLPQDKLNSFLEKFEIKKVSELPDSRLVDALLMANQLQKPSGEVDPFE